jgi:hypothetical protein
VFVALVASAVLSIVATFPGMWISLVLARWLSGARLRALLGVIPAFIGIGFAILAPAVGTFFERTGSRELDVQRLNEIARSASGALHALPTSWAADIVIGVARGRWAVAGRGLVLITLVGVATCALAYTTFSRSFLRSWTTLSEASTRVRRSSLLDRLAEPFGGAARALVAKEWKLFTRDLRVLAGAFFPFVFMTYFVISGSRQSGTPPYGLIAFIAFFIPGQASQSLINEKRNITLLRSMPLRGIEILAGKLLAFMPGIVVLAAGSSIGLYIVGRLDLVQAIVLALAGTWIVAWVTWGQLGIAALLSNFDTERGRLGLVAALSGLAHTLIFAGAHASLAGWVFIRSRPGWGFATHPVVGLVLAGIVAAACVATFALSEAGGRRLERIDSP